MYHKISKDFDFRPDLSFRVQVVCSYAHNQIPSTLKFVNYFEGPSTGCSSSF